MCACVSRFVSKTYCDDIQDAEKAVYTITWVNLFHHTLLAILETRNSTLIIIYTYYLLEELYCMKQLYSEDKKSLLFH